MLGIDKQKQTTWEFAYLKHHTISRRDLIWVWDIFLHASEADLHLVFDIRFFFSLKLKQNWAGKGSTWRACAWVCFHLDAYIRFQQVSQGLFYILPWTKWALLYIHSRAETFPRASCPPTACTQIKCSRRLWEGCRLLKGVGQFGERSVPTPFSLAVW